MNYKIIIYLILLLNIASTQQTEIDGKLKVKGEIDASDNRITNVAPPTTTGDAVNVDYLSSSLSGEGPWEYKIITVWYYRMHHTTGYVASKITYYKEYDLNTNDYDGTNWGSYLNTLAADGWFIDKIVPGGDSGTSSEPFLFILKRKL